MLKCEMCGNIEKIDRSTGSIRIIKIKQCDSCKLMVCNLCVKIGRYDKALDKYLLDNNLDISASICPKCEAIIGPYSSP